MRTPAFDPMRPSGLCLIWIKADALDVADLAEASTRFGDAEMASQMVSPNSQGQSKVGVSRAGLALGLLLGGLHLLWAPLVANGWAQPLMDFIFWLHFISPVYAIGGFDPLRAAVPVLLTGTIGCTIGGAYALLWNRMYRADG